MATDKFPDRITIGEKYGPAMEIRDQAAADAYFERCVRHCMRVGMKSRLEAESIERTNLGYYAGYYDNQTRQRVEQLYHCQHPYFGSIEKNGPPDRQTAYNIGAAIGAAMKGGRRGTA